MPFYGMVYLLFPDWFIAQEDVHQFNIFSVGHTAVVGYPTLLAEFSKLYAILYGDISYIQNQDKRPTISIWTFVTQYVISQYQIVNILFNTSIMLPWSFLQLNAILVDGLVRGWDFKQYIPDLDAVTFF